MSAPYAIPIYRVALVRDSAHASPTRLCADSASAYALLRDYFAGADREMLVVVMLDAKKKVIGINTVSIGSVTDTIAHPREVFKPAILSNALAVILAHNHPSGDPTPSPDDVSLTANLRKAGDILGIQVLDHLVLGEGRYVSLADTGQL